MLMDVYHAGARDFGENKVQELVEKDTTGCLRISDGT